MENYIPISYNIKFQSFNYFFEKHLGLLPLAQTPLKHNSTQTETFTQEKASQTKKPGLIWSYFA